MIQINPLVRMVVPAGIIVMWSGTLTNIPYGWVLCDGTNGTPDLRSKFIKGSASGVNPGVTGGATSATYTPAGTVSIPTFTGNSGSTNSVSAGTPAGTVAWPASVPTIPDHTSVATKQGSSAGNVVTTKTHSVSWPASVPTFSGSALGTHSHTITPAGTISQPTFTGQQASIPTEPVFYSLAFIMKVYI